MNYPLISDYIEAIKSAEDNFKELTSLSSVLGDDGLPVMTSGNFAVVFKMKDKTTGNLFAVKCFTKEQKGRAEAYRQIAEELEFSSSYYLTPIKYFERELFVDTNQTDETEFPVLLMEWIDGIPMDKFIYKNINNKYALELLTYRFSKMAEWLLKQPFAHGDLKPDNILVKEDGSIVLVDYDGMYVPTMKGQEAREVGSPNYRHPLRSKKDFDNHIDDFPIVVIMLSLKLFSIDSSLFMNYQEGAGLLLDESDYQNICKSKVMPIIMSLLSDMELCGLLGLFFLVLSQKRITSISYNMLRVRKPRGNINIARSINENNNKSGNYETVRKCIEEQEYEKAYHIMTMQENLKDKYCQNGLGCFYARGIVVEQNMEKAAYWFRASAMQGLGIAQFNLANCYYLGRGIGQSSLLADYWYSKAISQGVKLAGEMKTYESTGFSKQTEVKQNIERWRKIASLVYQA